MRRFLYTGILVALVGLPLTAQTAPTPTYQYSRLFYYTDTPAHKKDFFEHAAYVDVFAPQSYVIFGDGSVGGSLSEDLIAFAHANKISIMPLVTNGAFNASTTVSILSDPLKRRTAIATLIEEAQRCGYVGWQLDFEQIPVAYKDDYSAFVDEAATELHRMGLLLSVAVVSKVSDVPTDYKGKLWVNLIGAYDYDALAASADFISVMSYDDPESTGPVVEFPWLVRVLNYSLLHIPAAKLSLGVPLYYWKWNDFTGKLVGIGGYTELSKLLTKYPKAPYYYDPTYKAPSIYYKEKGIPYTVWYENARSVADKIALVKHYKLQGISLWALGLENPSVYQSLKR
ncbi:MAG: glycoside hydrolase, family 18 [Parcubacteria group bacterium]|nr:glycoside hydrolase, family 18 [Parcubacteria group bacterium]